MHLNVYRVVPTERKHTLFQRPCNVRNVQNDVETNHLCYKQGIDFLHLNVYRVIPTERKHTLFQHPSNVHNIQIRLAERKATPCVIRDYLL